MGVKKVISLFFVMALFSVLKAEEALYIVSAPVVNVRTGPADAPSGLLGPVLSKDLISKDGYGQETQVLYGELLYGVSCKDNESWVCIRSCDQWTYGRTEGGKRSGYCGFVAKSALVKIDSFFKRNLLVTDSNAILYSDLSCKEPLMFLSLGTKLSGFFEEEGVYKISLPNAEVAYIPQKSVLGSNFLANLSAGERRQRIIALARSAVGLPYVWGGGSWHESGLSQGKLIGFDCSSFVELLYRCVGIDIPRDAGDQLRYSVPVKKAQAFSPGDVLFFAHKEAPSRIHHVILYAGDDCFIHCTGRGFSFAHEASSKKLGVCEERGLDLFCCRDSELKDEMIIPSGDFEGDIVYLRSFFR